MKRIFCIIICLLIPVSACAGFLEDFNDFAVYVYGISPLSCADPEAVPLLCGSDAVQVIHSPEHDTITGKDDLQVIAAACCVLRCTDNTGNRIDHYGRILHAYFMSKSGEAGKEYRATTDSGILIYTKISEHGLIIKLVY